MGLEGCVGVHQKEKETGGREGNTAEAKCPLTWSCLGRGEERGGRRGLGSQSDLEGPPAQRQEIWAPPAGYGERSEVFKENLANFLFRLGSKYSGRVPGAEDEKKKVWCAETI